MFPLYLQYLLIDFHQNFVTGASWDTDDLSTFLGQKVKVQGHMIAAEAHSTRRYRWVQLFLVYFVNWLNDWLLVGKFYDLTEVILCKFLLYNLLACSALL